MRHKRAGIAFVCIGAVLILSALLLFLYVTVSDSAMAQENRAVYEELVRIAAQKRAEHTVDVQPQPTDEPGDHTDTSVDLPLNSKEVETEETHVVDGAEYTPMTVVRIGEFDYIGFLDISTLSLSLPVLAESDEKSLAAAPCRQFGSPDTDDLVIAGHNYRRHFANLSQLKIDDTVQFTDMDGDSVVYRVAAVTAIEATEVEAVLNTAYELILYTCDYTGGKRIAVFCERT